MGSRTGTWGGLLTVLMSAIGCNALTGADSVVIGDGGGSSAGGHGSGAGGPGAGVPTSAGPADGVSITAISLYQGVRRPLMENGAAANSTVPIVAGRDALMRVFYAVDPGVFNGQPVSGVATFGDNEPLVVQTPVGGSSTEEDLGSTVNFDVPAALLDAGSYRVELLHGPAITSGTNLSATYPAEGQDGFFAQYPGPQVKIMLIPIAYGADGSDRLPDTSDAQVQRYHDTIFRLYPVVEAQITVLGATQWNGTVSPLGQGWQALLDAIMSFRQSNGAAPDEYYYGIFAPSSSFSAFCNGGCVSGLSMLAGPNDAFARVGVGLGFSGQPAADTAAHEVGHQHGRGHSPCQVNQGLDPAYPYPGGVIGEWGYDLLGHTLRLPSTADFMSYCDPVWISDYNFKGLFDRIKLVNGADMQLSGPAGPTPYQRVRVEVDGSTSWQAPLVLDSPPTGQPVAVTAETVAGPVELTGHYYPYSHLPGGMLLIPQTPTPTKSIQFNLGQRHQVLSR